MTSQEKQAHGGDRKSSGHFDHSTGSTAQQVKAEPRSVVVAAAGGDGIPDLVTAKASSRIRRPFSAILGHQRKRATTRLIAVPLVSRCCAPFPGRSKRAQRSRRHRPGVPSGEGEDVVHFIPPTPLGGTNATR